MSPEKIIGDQARRGVRNIEKVLHLTKSNGDGDPIPNEAVVLFCKESLPEYIQLGEMPFKVRTYEQKSPLQCY